MNIKITKPNQFCSKATCITIQCTSFNSLQQLYISHEGRKQFAAYTLVPLDSSHHHYSAHRSEYHSYLRAGTADLADVTVVQLRLLRGPFGLLQLVLVEHGLLVGVGRRGRHHVASRIAP